MSFTFEETLTRVTYGPGSVGWPTTTASWAPGGNAANGLQSISSGRTGRKRASSGWWPRLEASLLASVPISPLRSLGLGDHPSFRRTPILSRTGARVGRRGGPGLLQRDGILNVAHD